ncbi:MAG: winged helix-turn-helix protein, partial [Microbacterium sp.]|nr:winged helix-turn-helix protein [Microbacterium sp.]
AGEIPDTATVRRPPDGWSGSNQVPHMLEFLSRQGVVAVAGREGRHRRWDLAERVYPADLPEYEPEEAERRLAERRLQAAGIAKQKSPWTPVGDAGEPAVIEGSTRRYNPYDSILFDRPRLSELFDFAYVLEQFKPKPQRRYGFFAHPILLGDRFVGMLDAEVDRIRGELRVNAVHEFSSFDPEEAEMVRAELAELGEWLGMPVLGLD